MKIEPVTIIGAGPAGIATAIQLRRSGLSPIMLEKSHIGGLLVNANLVENYPGFPKGISGMSLVRLFNAQLEQTGQKVGFEEVLQLDYEDDFIIRSSKQTLRSRIVVIASGTRPKEIDIPAEAAGKIFYEVSPIACVEGKKIAIIGAGDAAFDYALNLSRNNNVIILNRSNALKCLPLLWERVQKSERISYQGRARIKTIKSSADGLTLRCESPQGEWELQADYAIFAIGRTAELDYFSQRIKGQIADLQKNGLLYFVGDVKNDIYRQTSIAIGDGIHAAMRIYRKLQGTDSCES